MGLDIRLPIGFLFTIFGVLLIAFGALGDKAIYERSLGINDIGETFDVITTVRGGGVMGQADAVKLGIARALMVFNPELRKALKSEGLVTRDSRGKERKKYGQKGARKRFQFSKR